jgi:hypothetical protein
VDLDVGEVGRLLFGRPCRLRVALWIHSRGARRFYQSEPPDEVIPQSAAGTEHREAGSRRVYYETTGSPLWNIIVAAARVMGPPR